MDTGKKGCSKGGKQENEGSGQKVCGTGEMLYRRDTGKVECRTGGMQDMWDAGLEGCRKRGGMQERRYSSDKGSKFGSEMAPSNSVFSFDVAVAFRLLNVLLCEIRAPLLESI